MKAVLVIDMPTDCIKCPLADGYCWNIFPTKGKADNCPLKPLPSRMNNHESAMVGSIQMDIGYTLGWNACIEEIE